MLRFHRTLRTFAIASALLSGLAGLGCAGMSIQDHALMFEVSQRRYTQLMRYTDFERAGRYVAPDERSLFRERTAALGDVQFTDYEVRETEILGSTATATVAYVGYRESAPIVVTYLEEQQWERDGSEWLVRSQIVEPLP